MIITVIAILKIGGHPPTIEIVRSGPALSMSQSAASHAHQDPTPSTKRVEREIETANEIVTETETIEDRTSDVEMI